MRPVRYEYSALEQSLQIRLIDLQPRQGTQLQCSVRIFDLDHAPRFTALSYTHGPPVARDEGDQERYDRLDLVPLMCEGKELLLQPNLASALIQCDRSGRFGLYWTDAVCMDLENVLERRNQVALMGDIYWRAHTVLIWLGEGGLDSEVAEVFINDLLPKMQDFVKRERAKSDTFAYSFSDATIWDKVGIDFVPQKIWDILADFFEKRRWFGRVWTCQEALLAKRIQVLCGETIISWKKLEVLLRVLRKLDWDGMLSTRHDLSPQNGIASQEKSCVRINAGESLHSTMQLRRGIFESNPDYQTYLGHVAGGSDNMDMILGYFDHLIIQMRFRSAVDPRDHYFSLYGVIGILCDMADPKLPNPLMMPDYTKTVAEVYTANINSLLAHSNSLHMLAHIEDRSQRKRTDLPSWVPDVTIKTTQSFASRGHGIIFNASAGALPKLLPAPSSRTLSLEGYLIDVISNTGDATTRGNPGGPFECSPSLVLGLPTTYFTGQDRAEALWRTLVANMCPDDHLAPETMGMSFHDYVTRENAIYLREAQDKGHLEYEIALRCMEPFTALAKSTLKAACLIPSLEKILERKAAYTRNREIREGKAEPGAATPSTEEVVWLNAMQEKKKRQNANSLQFYRSWIGTSVFRRLFTTEGSLLGLGPQSAMPRDHIFVLPGARAPFVLRPITCPLEVDSSDIGRVYYEMVGEAYVHGIMNGEALKWEKAEKLDLNII